MQGGFQQLIVAAAELVEVGFKPALKAPHQRLGPCRPVLVSAHDVHHESGDERSRKEIRGEHGEDYGFGQRHKQKFRHSRQEKHGHKHNADTNCGNKGRDRDLLGAIQNRLFHLLALRQVALDVFDFHGGIVNENADGEGQTAQGHDVDSLPQRTKHEDRDKDRKRDGDRDDNRGTPVAQEQQDHARGQDGSSQRFQYHPTDGCAHEQRLIEERGDIHFRRKVLRRNLSGMLHAFHNRDRRGDPHFQHRHERAPHTVHAHDVGLWREAIADVGNIAHIDGRAFYGLHR